jgi:hypothetical protein
MSVHGRTRAKGPARNAPADGGIGVSDFGGQRFAVEVSGSYDAPDAFRDALKKVTDIHGPVEVGFFLPAMVRPGKSGTVVVPQRLACILKNHFLLLSLETDSHRVAALLSHRSHLLGYRITGFLLDCWITVYQSFTPREIPIQFPVQSGELYSAFVKALFHRTGLSSSGVQTSVNHSVLSLNCPAPFIRFLHQHPELGEFRDAFLQTAVPFGKTRRQKCTNLLIATTNNAMIALTDEEPFGASWLGLRVTYVLLHSVARAEWKDQFHLQQGVLFLYIGSGGNVLRLEWSLAMRFRRAALEWIESLNSTLAQRTATNEQSI